MLIALALTCLAFPQDATPAKDPPPLSADELRAAGKVAGLEFDEDELKLMLKDVRENLASFEKLRAVEIPNSIAPAFGFSPLLPGVPAHVETLKPVARTLTETARPAQLEELAFADIATLASLVRSRKVSCTELVELSLARLKRLDPELHCVVTLCEERARKEAQALDEELARGKWRGPLHGLPWGAKDLLATKGVRTTWGSSIYEQQELDFDATVVAKLDEAGAVLVAKLSLGELAMGDVWYGGTTKNPWKLEQGSSGSSAGPASATAAGCIVFGIGSETCGSIVSPSARCGCSSLRPTFGRVSRYGAMALAWSMDKIGPLCRSVADAAIVFDAIEGVDPLDDSTIAQPFADLGPIPVKGMKCGYVKGSFGKPEREKEILDSITALGMTTVEVEMPDAPVEDLMLILSAEAATAFDDLTRSGQDERMTRQSPDAWPNLFRTARTIPAVEYIRASRVRRILMADVAKVMAKVDVLVHPSTGGRWLVTWNMTGHPSVCVPAGPREDGTPRSITFTGQLFGEARLLAIAEAWQNATGFHRAHPTMR
jgi:Asp-tRNA(Asn)/Glu-tRNA(Gln) amidotransferase A subunit family amidase